MSFSCLFLLKAMPLGVRYREETFEELAERAEPLINALEEYLLYGEDGMSEFKHTLYNMQHLSPYVLYGDLEICAYFPNLLSFASSSLYVPSGVSAGTYSPVIIGQWFPQIFAPFLPTPLSIAESEDKNVSLQLANAPETNISISSFQQNNYKCYEWASHPVSYNDTLNDLILSTNTAGDTVNYYCINQGLKGTITFNNGDALYMGANGTLWQRSSFALSPDGESLYIMYGRIVSGEDRNHYYIVIYKVEAENWEYDGASYTISSDTPTYWVSDDYDLPSSGAGVYKYLFMLDDGRLTFNDHNGCIYAETSAGSAVFELKTDAFTGSSIGYNPYNQSYYILALNQEYISKYDVINDEYTARFLKLNTRTYSTQSTVPSFAFIKRGTKILSAFIYRSAYTYTSLLYWEEGDDVSPTLTKQEYTPSDIYFLGISGCVNCFAIYWRVRPEQTGQWYNISFIPTISQLSEVSNGVGFQGRVQSDYIGIRGKTDSCRYWALLNKSFGTSYWQLSVYRNTKILNVIVNETTTSETTLSPINRTYRIWGS